VWTRDSWNGVQYVIIYVVLQKRSLKTLKRILDRFYKEFDFQERVQHDPIRIPQRYSTPEDIEAAGFIAASFAYGKVGLFKPVIEAILKPGKKRPALFFKNFSIKKDAKYLKGVHYRFNREKDILCFVYLVSEAIKKRDSLMKLFYSCLDPDSNDIKNAMSGFTEFILNTDTTPVYGRNIRPYGLKQLFPSPQKGSACKRTNLFLRWMVRKRDIDFGIWDNIPASKLIIPLDTHIARISKCLGLTQRNAPDWKTAKEITEALKEFDPEDPLKYDFALCHHGIAGLCKGRGVPAACSSCTFNN
jgi:uncharacterized protein (TIGR02757 family)